MIKFIRLLPFILLALYYLLIKTFVIEWKYRLALLGFMILISLFLFLKKDKEFKWNKSALYLFLGILSVLMIMTYFNNVA
ncbi:hypothetical protein KRX57_01500 [Weeksellaceae bacterium TAE3-ERU29]|nr:hypothetical protein [Weeksellaceae bacterium TAE3-ERU29]